MRKKTIRTRTRTRTRMDMKDRWREDRTSTAVSGLATGYWLEISILLCLAAEVIGQRKVKT